MYENIAVGVPIIIVGIVVLILELIHPGLLLLIPGSVLIVGGFLYLFLPDILTQSPIGAIVIIITATVAGMLEIPLYRHFAPTHKPMTTTSAGLEGEVAVVIAPIIPDSLKGKIRVRSEVWSARSDRPIPVGAQVRIVSGEGVSVYVVPAEPAAARPA